MIVACLVANKKPKREMLGLGGLVEYDSAFVVLGVVGSLKTMALVPGSKWVKIAIPISFY